MNLALEDVLPELAARRGEEVWNRRSPDTCDGPSAAGRALPR